jgi:site-specific recombinase XerD
MTTTTTSAAELAEEWLARKRLGESDDQVAKGNSDRARRQDLARWGRLLGLVSGRTDGDWPPHLDLATDLDGVRAADFADGELLGRALAAARTRYSSNSVHRMLSTLRGFTRWLARQGHVAVDAAQDDELRVRRERTAQVRAIDLASMDRIRTVAAAPPPVGSRMWWPARDTALVELLSGCGLRASEVVASRVGWIDRRPERPVVRIAGGKGAKDREVPVPRRVDVALVAYLDERQRRAQDGAASTPGLATVPSARLFVRPDGRPLDPSALDRLVRGLATRAGVELPDGAAAHAFRHHYGVELALRGVPQAVIQQLLGHASADTTAVYTRVASRDLIAALDDAGLL